MRLHYPVLAGLIAFSCQVDRSSSEPRVVSLPSPAASPSAEPYLFTSEDSVIYLTWIEKAGDTARLKMSTLEDNHWSAPELIASGDNWFVNWADYPMLTKNQDKLLAHFPRKNGEGALAYEVILTSSADEGRTWTPPHPVHEDGTQAEHGFVSLVPYHDGFFVAWLDGRNTVMEGMEGMEGHEEHHGQMSLRAAVLDMDLRKLNEWELDNRTCDCCQTAAAITSQGPVVVYRDRSAEEIRDMSIVRLVNGVWTEPKPIHHDRWKIAGCPVNGPRMVAYGNHVAVAWYTMAEERAAVYVTFSSDAGQNFGEPVRIDEGNAIGRVDLVWLDDDRVMVSWMEGPEIKAAAVTSEGTKERSLTIANSSTARASGFPQMTRAGNRIIFAWTDSEVKNIKTISLDFKHRKHE